MLNWPICTSAATGWTEAEKVLAKALEVSGGGDVALRERLEDVQVRHSRQQVQLAERRCGAGKNARGGRSWSKK